MRIVETVIEANTARKSAMVDKIEAACGGSVSGKTLSILGLTFKPNTDDMREAPSLVIVPGLQERGARIRAYDPEGMGEAGPLLPGVTWCESAEAAMTGGDALVVLTEWNEFRGLDARRIAAALRGRVIVDLRNIFDAAALIEAGFDYVGIGRRPMGDKTGS